MTRRLFLLSLLCIALTSQRSAAQDSGGEQKPPAPSADDAVAYVPFDFCVQRMLDPLRALTGQNPSGFVPGAVKARADHVEQITDAQIASFRKQVSAVADALQTSQAAQLEVAIATLPDPIDSGLVYAFESMLQALRLGFEAAAPGAAGAQGRELNADGQSKGWFRDRSFLPWGDRQVGAQLRALSEACRRALPGVLVFRNSDPVRPRVLVVLVVGETPTSGVHSAALLNALRTATLLAPEATTDKPLRIIGPSFSGSAYSLRVALQTFAKSEPDAMHSDFSIISGTASGSDVARTLQGGDNATPKVSYSATTVPESAADCAYLRFLKHHVGVDTLPRTGSSPLALEGVATLRESGTEFGATSLQNDRNAQICDLRSELTISFPIQVSRLRDAYEDLERREHPQPAELELPISRARELEATLGETRIAPEIEANPSPKTRAAMDVRLNRLLGEISRHAVRHVSIHATDVGDAVFLARKIREVAPDVRFAFFEPDDLLLHPQHRTELLGSLVVSPYPFLGVSDFQFSGREHHEYTGFPSSSAQGLFNAVLAQRGVPPGLLFDDAFSGDPAKAPLLIWVSTIARTGLVPLSVVPPLDCERTIYEGGNRGPGNPMCTVTAPAVRDGYAAEAPPPEGLVEKAWRSYNPLRDEAFPVDPSLTVPRSWNFCLLCLLLLFALDWVRQARTTAKLASDRMPASFADGDERAADRAIGRTKWWLYAAIRRFLFVLALGYMSMLYGLAVIAHGFWRHPVGWSVLALALCVAIAVAGYHCGRACQHFWRDYTRFARYVNVRLFPRPIEWLDGFRQGRISWDGNEPTEAVYRPRRGGWRLLFARSEPVGRYRAARVSFAQLRLVALCAFVLAVGFSIGIVFSIGADGNLWHFKVPGAVPKLTLNVLRNLPIMNGVSPAAPVLLCIACVYVWAVGRMARLALVHAVSRVAPHDHEIDLVSTPIRLVLYPNYRARSFSDEGYTQTERDLLNAIWRPITGKYFVPAWLAVLVLPIALFWLKPLSTIELELDNVLLSAGLGLGAVLIGGTLVQLVQYWTSLSRLLERTAAHPLAPAFRWLPEFARSTIEGQLSGTPDMLLRWVACARQLDVLAARLPHELSAAAKEVQDKLQQALRLTDAPRSALWQGPETLPPARDADASMLAESLISAAALVSGLLPELSRVRRVPVLASQALPQAVGQTIVATAEDEVVTVESRPCIIPPESEQPPLAADIPAAVSGALQRRDPVSDTAPIRPRTEELATIADAQGFVVTVVTLLIQQHVRQLRYFMSTLVLASMLLLIAVASYPFEPYRLLLSCMWVIVGSVVTAGLWIYVQLNRNLLIRNMTHSPERRSAFSYGVALRVFTWVIIPVLSVAAAQFPNLASFLFPLISPFVRALK